MDIHHVFDKYINQQKEISKMQNYLPTPTRILCNLLIKLFIEYLVEILVYFWANLRVRHSNVKENKRPCLSIDHLVTIDCKKML